MWRPIELHELEKIVAMQLPQCSRKQRHAFEKFRVFPFYQIPIKRFEKVEYVYVVAKFPSGLMYYEGKRSTNPIPHPV